MTANIFDGFDDFQFSIIKILKMNARNKYTAWGNLYFLINVEDVTFEDSSFWDQFLDENAEAKVPMFLSNACPFLLVKFAEPEN